MNPILWQPDAKMLETAKVTQYMRWLSKQTGLSFEDYNDLWQWSIDETDAFWQSIWDYFDIQSSTEYSTVLQTSAMPGAEWFSGASVNYAAQVFRNSTTERPAIVFQSETTALQEISWAELEADVASMAAYLRRIGVRPGDRVVAYLPNIPEATVAFLASASVGAIWSMCAPDLGVKGVLDRFQQIKPKVLIAVNGYTYGGKSYDRAAEVTKLVAGLPSLTTLVSVRKGGANPVAAIDEDTWSAITSQKASLETTDVAFDHPLWILYSSGTTGTPKAIVHSQGGIIIEHLKSLHFHFDLGPDDRFFWYSSTAWMMWNLHVGGLLLGTTICIYDGNPAWPDMTRLWRFISDSEVTYFGAGAAFYDGCRNAEIMPRMEFDLSALRAVGSTGSPLLPESYHWIYENVSADAYLAPISGGTDFASGFVGGIPILPVRLGEMSCRCLGAAVAAFNDDGEPIVDEVGELVCTKPMPSMPIYFWNDEGNRVFSDSYFDVWPGIWRHGDWIKITNEGGAIIYGRSDATINRYGIRMGTSELYSAVEALPEILDSLVVDLEFLGRDSYMPLFVVLRPGIDLSEGLMSRIREAIKTNLSPRHVPNDVFKINDVPRTFSGKKLEIPIRKLLLGQSSDRVINKETMSNPESVEYFIKFSETLRP